MGGFVLDTVTVADASLRVLDAVSAHLEAGRCTAVVGASGAGKTTLLRLLNRMIEPTSGHVLWDGVPLTELDVLALRRRVGLVGQHPVLLTDQVADEVRVACPDLTEGDVVTLLDRVGLSAGFVGRLTRDLSGGEAQRVCLARTLALTPEVLLLDEPTSSLDGRSAIAVQAVARGHVAAGGTVVLASHDLPAVRQLAHAVLVVDHGRMVAAGRPDEIAYLRAEP